LTARGPGGRIPNQGNGPAAKGVGKNAKRHDLERQDVPPLHDSDLQQGDVQALEQGQRIAPVRSQAPAVPQQAGGSARQDVGGGAQQPAPMDIINSRLGNTMATQGTERTFDPAKARLADKWAGFYMQLSQHPNASPVLKAQARQQANDLRATRTAPKSQIMDLGVADGLIEDTLNSEGF